MSITPEQLREEFIKWYNSHRHLVADLLYAKRARRVTDRMKGAFAAALFLHEHGLPITTSLVSFLTGTDQTHVAELLHRLGDNKALHLRRGERGQVRPWLEWVVDAGILEAWTRWKGRRSEVDLAPAEAADAERSAGVHQT